MSMEVGSGKLKMNDGYTGSTKREVHPSRNVEATAWTSPGSPSSGCSSGQEIILAYTPRISRCHILDAAVMHRCDRSARKDGATALECAPTDKRTVTRALTLSINVILRTHHSIWSATTALDVRVPIYCVIQVACPAVSQEDQSGTEPRSHVATADPKQGTQPARSRKPAGKLGHFVYLFACNTKSPQETTTGPGGTKLGNALRIFEIIGIEKDQGMWAAEADNHFPRASLYMS